MKKRMHIISSLFLAGIFMLSATASATEAIYTSKTTPNNEHYKDSFYFNWGGKNYLAVSDGTRGGISVLIGGSNGTQDSNYTLYHHIGGGNNWAPAVYNHNNTLWFVTTHFSFNNSYLKAFTYNPATKSVGTTYDLRNYNSYLKLGHTDATIYWHNGYWYMFTSKWHSNYLGSKIVWQKSSSHPLVGYGPATTLRDQNGNELDRLRTDIDWVVEAPNIGWIPQTALGSSSLVDIYWSVGPSDPNPAYTSAVRRGDLNWNGSTPWVFVFGDLNGPGLGNMVSSNMDYNHLTHPDITAAGYIRATSMKDGVFCIVDSTHR